jgi:hypothetical protein
MTPSQLVSGLANDDFARVLGACPRRARETLFTSFGIPKAKKSASALLPAKDPARIRKLQGAMAQITPDDEQGQQLAEELVRVYLMTRRGLLGDALDAIGITHDDGLTDEDLDAFARLEAADLSELRVELSKQHDAVDVDLYLRFMGAEFSA